MQVRQLYGAHAGEIVQMPYHVAMRALESGTIALVETDDLPPPGDEPPPSSIIDARHDQSTTRVADAMRAESPGRTGKRRR